MDRIPKAARRDLGALAGQVLPLARSLLQARTSFYPFGMAMKPDGSMVAAFGYDETTALGPQEAHDLLLDGWARAAEEEDLRATVDCLHVQVEIPESEEPIPALQLRMEHVSGVAYRVYLPIQLHPSGEIAFGESIVQEDASRVFEA